MFKGKPETQDEKKSPAPTTEAAVLDLDPDAILGLLELPFLFAGSQSGFYYEIPKKFRTTLAATATKAVKDFGIEIVSKWINLGVFLGIYGFCLMDWKKQTDSFIEKKAIEEKQKEPEQPRLVKKSGD